MKLRTTLILFLICFALGGYLYFVEQKLPTTEQLKEQSQFIFRITEEEVGKLQFLAGADSILCERIAGSGQWNITQPLSAKADKEVVNNILKELASLKKESDLGKTPLADYGLQTPQNEIRFWIKEREYQLAIGNQAAVGGQVYVSTGEGDVFLIEDDRANSFKKILTDLRDKTLLEGTVVQVNHLMLKKNGQTAIHCQKEQPDRWQMVQPGPYRGDRLSIEDWIREMMNLKASEFVMEESSDLASLGLQPPEGEIWIWIEGKTEPQVFLLGKNPEGREEFYAKLNGRPNIVLVNGSVKNLFNKQVLDLRDRRLFIFDQVPLIRLELAQGEQRWSFEKKEDKWEDEKVENAVRQLSFLSFLRLAEGIAETEAFPQDQLKTLKAWNSDQSDPLFVLTIGAKTKEGDEYYVKTSQSSEVYLLSSAQIENLLALKD